MSRLTNTLFGPLKLVLGFVLLALNTVFWSCLILGFTPLKYLFARFHSEKPITLILRKLYSGWYNCIPLVFQLIGSSKLIVETPESLSQEESYLLISNHQSWLDIPILLSAVGKQISTPIFFLKQELIWVPFMGQACWAIDMIFVSRSSKKRRRGPQEGNSDLKNAQEKCQKLIHLPTTVINFIEGTRFTEKKHKQGGSQYNHLLSPKYAGVNFALNAMGPQLSHILDVSLIYPLRKKYLLVEFLSGKLPPVTVKIQKIPITPDLFGDYQTDKEYRKYFKERVNKLWTHKDNTMKEFYQAQA